MLHMYRWVRSGEPALEQPHAITNVICTPEGFVQAKYTCMYVHIYVHTVVSRCTKPIGALETRLVYPEVQYAEYDSVNNMNPVTGRNRSMYPEACIEGIRYSVRQLYVHFVFRINQLICGHGFRVSFSCAQANIQSEFSRYLRVHIAVLRLTLA